MDLRKYIYTHGRKSIRISEQIECTKHTISNIKTRKFTPNLLTALKLTIISNGQIELQELLKKEDKDLFDSWIEKNNLDFNYRVILAPKKPHPIQ